MKREYGVSQESGRMHMRSNLRIATAAATAIFMIALASCGGGGINDNFTIAPSAGGPTVGPSPLVASTVSEVTAGGTFALPEIEGYSGSFAIPATATIPAGTSVNATAYSSVPSGLPPITAIARRNASGSFKPMNSGGVQTVVYVAQLVFSSQFTLSPFPTVTMTVPAANANATYYIALLTPGATSWQQQFLGPTTSTSTRVAFAAPAGTYEFAPQLVYAIALVEITTGTPTPSPSSGPTPTPTMRPTPTPTPVPTPTPTPIPVQTPTPGATPTPVPSGTPGPVMLAYSTNQFLGTGDAPVTVTVTQSNGSFGGVSAAMGCNVVVSVYNLTSDTFQVSPVGAGFCTLTVYGSLGPGGGGPQANVTFSVTTTMVTGQ